MLPTKLYLAVNRERVLIPNTLYVFICAIVTRHWILLVIDIWVHYWKVAIQPTGRRYVDCRTPWSYSYAGTSERRHWSLISQSGKRSKDYVHEDGLIGPLNYGNCMFGPLVLLWSRLQVVIQSDDPGHFLTDQSSKVVIDSVMQQSSNEVNVILSTLTTNSILESPCFPSSDYECRMGKWLMGVRNFLAWPLPILGQMNKWLFWYWCHPHTGIIPNFHKFWKSSKSLPVHTFFKKFLTVQAHIYLSLSQGFRKSKLFMGTIAMDGCEIEAQCPIVGIWCRLRMLLSPLMWLDIVKICMLMIRRVYLTPPRNYYYFYFASDLWTDCQLIHVLRPVISICSRVEQGGWLWEKMGWQHVSYWPWKILSL